MLYGKVDCSHLNPDVKRLSYEVDKQGIRGQFNAGENSFL